MRHQEGGYAYSTGVTQFRTAHLDGGSTILLANMLSPKRLICKKDFPMARPLPSHSYVLVNRSILCNCDLQTGLNYLLKSLSSCDSGAPFTMYFAVNSAFQHFMSEFCLYDSPSPNGQLLSQEYLFDIFLNDTSKPSIHPTHHGLYYLWTLQTLFWNCFNPYLPGLILSPIRLSLLLSSIPVWKFQIIQKKAHSCSQHQPTLHISAQHAY